MDYGNVVAKRVATLSPNLLAFAYSQETGGYPVLKAYLKNNTYKQLLVKDVHLSGNFSVNPSIPNIIQPNEELEFEVEVGDSFVSEAQNGFLMVQFYEGEAVRITLSQEETTGATSPEQDLQNQITALENTVDGINTTLASLNSSVSALLGADGDINSLIATESTARVDGDTALANTIALIGAQSGDGLSFILDMDSVMAAPDESLAQRFSTLSTQIGNNTAAITQNLSTVTTSISSEASRIDVLQASVDTNTAAITTEATARADGDSALSQSITTLSTTVGDNTASINTISTTVDGIDARYTLQLDVNGHVTGYTAENDGVTGSIVFVADQFAVVDPNGGAPITPFQIVNGQVVITTAQIGTLSVDNLIDGSLTADVGLDGDINVQDGHIVFDNGIYKKVQGLGFGSTSQFIEWFGPSIDMALMTEANAISYLKTNGDAYFGGTLSAGTLKNAAQSTSIANDVSLNIGPFDTNGNVITVVLSYSIKSVSDVDYPGTAQGESDFDAALATWGYTGGAVLPGGDVLETRTEAQNITIQLDRTREGVGTDSPWNTLQITEVTKKLVGLKPLAGGAEPGNLIATTTASGTITTTDSAGGLQKRTFTATMTARNLGVMAGTVEQQNMSLIATEE